MTIHATLNHLTSHPPRSYWHTNTNQEVSTIHSISNKKYETISSPSPSDNYSRKIVHKIETQFTSLMSQPSYLNNVSSVNGDLENYMSAKDRQDGNQLQPKYKNSNIRVG